MSRLKTGLPEYLLFASVALFAVVLVGVVATFANSKSADNVPQQLAIQDADTSGEDQQNLNPAWLSSATLEKVVAPLPSLSVPSLVEINDMTHFAELEDLAERTDLDSEMLVVEYEPGTVPAALGDALFNETGFTQDDMWQQQSADTYF